MAIAMLFSTQTVFGQLAYWVNNTGGTKPATVTVNSVSYTTAGTTYTDIQTAVTAAQNAAAGGVVFITDGRYVNPKSLVANSNCNLDASQSALLSISLNSNFTGVNIIITSETGDFRTSSAKLVGYGFRARDNNLNMLTIQGLQLDSVHVNGLYFESPYGDYGKCTIQNNKITNTRGHGIKTDSPANRGAWIVTGNCFQNIGYFDARGNCPTPFPSSALWLGEPGQITISNNIIKRVKWAGILLDGFSKPNGFVAGTETTVVTGNYISDTQDAGIQIGFSSVGTFFHPIGADINNNILKSCNKTKKVGIGAITFLNSNVEGVSITNNDISRSFNGIAIEIAGWDNSATTKVINNNNIYKLMGGYGVTHIANILPNGLFGTGDDLSFYNFDNNYWGAADGPLNAGGAGEELKKDAVNTAYSLGSFDYTPFATTSNTVTNTTCATCLTVDWYADADDDGYGNPGSIVATSCAWPAGYMDNNSDCSDVNATINPGETEIGNNGIDDDCNGTIDLPCTGPTGGSSSAVTASSAVISWTASAQATVYRVAYRIVGSTTWLTKNVAAPSTSTTISGLVPSSNYEWQLRSNACSINGFALASAWSALQNFTTSTASCGPFTGLITSNVTTNSVKFNWDLIAGVTKYTIYYRTLGSTTWIKRSNGTTATSRVISGLLPSTSYEWRLDITCADGTTAPSDLEVFTTLGFGRIGDNSSVWAFSIHPNPSNGRFTVTPLADVEGVATVQLFDVAGRIVLQQTWSASEDATLVFDKQLDNGMYMLNITAADGQTFTSRVVIAN